MQGTVAHLLETKGSAVWTVEPGATVYRALELMAEKAVGALVVTDGDLLAGIISERDYARKVILLDRGSKQTAVSEIMTADVVTVTSTSTLGECMNLMTDKRIRHLPVVDEERRVVGLVSIGDVVRAIIEWQQAMIQDLESYITG
ncbi:MAG TPA: CBS domain-containing protein [Acidimicrobiia bacterium]